jgi:hypothetical protein
MVTEYGMLRAWMSSPSLTKALVLLIPIAYTIVSLPSYSKLSGPLTCDSRVLDTTYLTRR